MAKREHSWDYWEDALAVAKELGYSNPDEAVIDLYNNGWSIRDIAIPFDRTTTGIRSKLKKLGVQMRPPGGNNRGGNRGDKT
ncbi:MAG: hypothetical protein GY834_10625 [Bacteroidetes bacterium]|nr:hypothetical protein [Bacteroidota bacterium]